MEPRIIPRHEHHISRKQMSPNAVRTLYRLLQRGFIAYLVGGCVRDLLLKRTPKDFDIATDATPGQVRRLFRNCRLIGRRFRLAHLHFQDEIIEVATFRKSARTSDDLDTEELGEDNRPFRHVKDADGMVVSDNVFGTPEEDALSRDFTVNALFYNIADFSVIDYSTGLNDLEERLIRLIGDPYIRFTEDPVRMLRAIRFAASHGFTIETSAWQALSELSSTISRVPTSRLYEEIQKVFLFGTARPALNLMNTSGLVAALFPGLNSWILKDYNHFRLIEANLQALDELHKSGAPASMALCLAALFGPALEEEALERTRDGIPRQQALDSVCTDFMEEARRTVCIPGRVGSGLRAILGIQPALHRMPPRRPLVIAGRREFAEGLAYLRLVSETRRENERTLGWWDAFRANVPLPPTEQSGDEATPKKRSRKRRRRRRDA
ncbi:MAG TPA: polynucleotide adenylyltransferase PcnB [Syntrophorhabdaceae bacterium]|nr:polynucleotide adenylyltransferase PcnB [Syntrophorhabdaceae bacterium]